MRCQNCGKNNANVKYTKIVNGVKTEYNLCSSCAKKMGVGDEIEIPFTLNSFLGDLFNDYAQTSFVPRLKNSIIKCKTCGTSYDDFINTGVFGCSDCYTTFEGPINALLKSINGTDKHVGRGPKGKGQDISIDVSALKNDKENSENNVDDGSKSEPKNETKDAKLKRLQKELDKAIKAENYEEAAKIRDQIKEMDK